MVCSWSPNGFCSVLCASTNCIACRSKNSNALRTSPSCSRARRSTAGVDANVGTDSSIVLTDAGLTGHWIATFVITPVRGAVGFRQPARS